MSVGRRWVRRGTAAGFVAAMALVGSCTNDDEPGGGEDEDVCEALDDVQAAVADVGDVDVVSEGTDALRTAGDDLVVALRGLRGAAGDEVGEEVDEVGAAVDELVEAIRALPATSSGGQPGTGITDVDTALDGLLVATEDLGDALQADC